MTKDEALKLALEALESVKHKIDSYQVNVCDDVDEAITAIREALAQPQQEPVAHMYPCDLEEFKSKEMCAYAYSIEYVSASKGETIPLYTTPPHRKPLTDEQIQYAFRTNSVVIDDGNAYMVARKRAINITRAIEAAHGIKEEA